MSAIEQRLPDISVVIPILNEAGNIRTLIVTLADMLRERKVSWEAILVDDGSTDNSWQELQALAAEFSMLSAIRFTRNFGKEAAIYAGLMHARGCSTLVMDSDLQHPPDLVVQMWTAFNADSVDIVSAVKTKRQEEHLLRGFGAKLFYWLFRRSAGIDLEYSTDFKLISSRVREVYLSLPEKHRFFRGLTSWLGFPEVTVPFDPPPRHSQTGSRWTTHGLSLYAVRSLVSFSSLPIRVLGWLGIGTLFFALALAIQTLLRKISGHAVEGFTTVILVLLLIGSILMIGLAIIGAYVSETYQQVRQRPGFIIQETRLSRAIQSDRDENST
jgi:dolichol-phosphate mannosyltransferase